MDEMTMLKSHHEAQPAPSPAAIAEARARLAAARPAPSRRRGALRYGVSLGAVAATAAALVLAPAMFSGEDSRAFAVERLPDGTIKVTLHEFTDADGIERKLRSYGARAAVDYLPFGMVCGNGIRGTLAKSQPAAVSVPARHRPGDPTFLIHPDLIRPGLTLVWTVGYQTHGSGKHKSSATRISSYLVKGPVEPCTPEVVKIRKHS